MRRRPGPRDAGPSTDLMSPVTEQDIGEPSSFVRPILRVLDEAEETIDESEQDVWHDSLDLANNDFEESHFLGASAVQDLDLEVPTTPYSSNFRQVSQDPRMRAFFVKSPAFFYGHGETASKVIAGRVYATLGPTWPQRLIQKFMQVTLPAFPIVNAMRLMASIETPVSQQNASYPHALLCGIIGHSITYEPEVRLLFGTVWKDAVAAEDEEYKAPRLQTLHLALISLATRPSQAHAVNAMSLARSVAIAHILGLHLDCAGWSLPRWEKSVRKRAWWALIVLDKWTAMIHGRPSLIHRINRSVPLPTLKDSDWGEFTSSQAEEDSMRSFIGQCELALVIETILDGFYSQESQRRTSHAEDLRRVGAEVDALQARLPACLTSRKGNAATGVRCFQLTLLGVRVLIARLHVSTPQYEVGGRSNEHGSYSLAVSVIDDFVLFLEELQPDSDFNGFWFPHCSFLMTTTFVLLLRVIRKTGQTPSLNTSSESASEHGSQLHGDAIKLAKRLVDTMLVAKEQHQWEVAETAMISWADILRSTNNLPSEVVELANRIQGEQQDNPWMDFIGQLGDDSWLNGEMDWMFGLGGATSQAQVGPQGQSSL
ncbi:hypothetical protein JCM24511_03727 [Saitozyma sp. JCM 24511]|nr:hypothetical protein JCM24511_03727 [Saitozyma sp. JCM 24511]